MSGRSAGQSAGQSTGHSSAVVNAISKKIACGGLFYHFVIPNKRHGGMTATGRWGHFLDAVTDGIGKFKLYFLK